MGVGPHRTVNKDNRHDQIVLVLRRLRSFRRARRSPSRPRETDARHRRRCSRWPRGSRRPTSAPIFRSCQPPIASCSRSSSRRRRSSTRCSCARSGPATRRCCCDLARDQIAGGARAPALLPDQQGAVVAARPQRGVRARRAGQAGRRQLLSRRRVEGRARALDPVAARGGARPRDRLLHGHPPRRQRRSRSCRTTSSTRASSRSRGGAAARGGAARRASRRSRRS